MVRGWMRKIVIGVMIAVMIVSVLALPVKQLCGGEGKVCATAPDDRGYVHFYYEKQPFVRVVVYDITGWSVPLVYSSGVERVKH